MQESTESGRDLTIGKRLITNFVVSEFFLIAGNLAIRVLNREGILPPWAVAVVTLVTILPMLLFAIGFFRMLRTDLDEMLQRIVLEGLAFAMIVFVPLAGFYVNARAAGLISSRLDPPEVLLLPSILVAIGVLISWSRLK
ncbi:MAG: hypothetical protein JNL67_08865 [Planctomycetaceae bacterium]|nr:hypothetical protein [Planctomycetaceae bacterium]